MFRRSPTTVEAESPTLAGFHGGIVPLSTLRVEVQGAPDAPVLVVLGGISASAHVAAHADDPTPGWWEAIVGPGRVIDPARYRIVSIDWLTVPGHPVDARDQANALTVALDRLGIASVEAIIGASYGGMVALAFATLFPARVGQLVVLSAAHESHPMATALRTIQRGVVRLGIKSGRAHEAIALARALGIASYRTAEEFAERFAAAPVRTATGYRFPVEEYLEHGGTRFAIRCEAERYLALSESIDLHRIDPAEITTPITLLAVEGDQLVPVWQVHELFGRLGGPGRVVEITSRYGHDAFLKEVEAVSELLTTALERRARHAA
ncbi:MAG: homoserine O-succinyltransferase [Gemmatimonadales bacterium]|nr:homoserine O-succinyltransferase [Gemmatimonadales bacterium]